MQNDQAASLARGNYEISLVLTHLEGPLPDRHGGSKGGLQAEGVRDRDPKILAAPPPALHQPVPVYPSEGTHIGDACSGQEDVPCNTNGQPFIIIVCKGTHVADACKCKSGLMLYTAEPGNPTWLKDIVGFQL